MEYIPPSSRFGVLEVKPFHFEYTFREKGNDPISTSEASQISADFN